MLAQIKFAKVKPGATIPSKREEDAGLDIYACFQEGSIVIEPHETKLIPTGIASACGKEFYFQLFEKSGTGTKGVGQRSGVMDSGWRGEWFVPITNHNTKSILITKETDKKALASLSHHYIIFPYTKAICQAVVLPVPELEIEELTYDELLKIESERGVGCCGSTGK